MTPDAAALLSAFESAAISHADWTHRAHLQVALACLTLDPLEDAIARFRKGIMDLNAAHGVPQTDTGGYHETLTQAYLRLIDVHLRGLPPSSTFEAREASVLATFADKEVILRHYSRARIMSREARFGFLPPDLLPFEQLS